MADELLSQEEIEALMSGAAGGGATETPADAGETEAAQVGVEPDAEAMEQPAAEVTDVSPQAPPDIRVSAQPEAQVRPAEFSPLTRTSEPGPQPGMDLIMDVQVQVAVELGRASLHVKEILGLGPGSVVELDKHAGEPVEVVVNGRLLARGEVVLIDENFGVRVTEIVGKAERESHAKAA